MNAPLQSPATARAPRTLSNVLLSLIIPWNDDTAEHVPTSLDAGGVMRVRKCNGRYRVEQLADDGTTWVPAVETMRWSKVQAIVHTYTG